jgi:hypothetical protein
VREPRDGARWLIDASRGETVVPLRATVSGMTVSDVTWEIDGGRIAGDSWEMSEGDHEMVAIWQGRRSAPARVKVERRR